MQNHCVQPMHPYKLVPSQDGSAQAYNRPWTGGIAGGAAAVRTTAPALPATVDSRPGAPVSGLGSDGEGEPQVTSCGSDAAAATWLASAAWAASAAASAAASRRRHRAQTS